MKDISTILFTCALLSLSATLHAEECDSNYTTHCNQNHLFFCSFNSEVANMDCGEGTCTEVDGTFLCIQPLNADCMIESDYEECEVPLHCSLDAVSPNRVCREGCSIEESGQTECNGNILKECKADGEGLTHWFDYQCPETCSAGECVTSVSDTDSGTAEDPLVEDAGTTETDSGANSPPIEDSGTVTKTDSGSSPITDAGSLNSDSNDNSCQGTTNTPFSFLGLLFFGVLFSRRKK